MRLVEEGAPTTAALNSPTASLIELSADLPVVIEAVDDQAHIDRLIPIWMRW